MKFEVWVHASEILTGEGIARKDGRHPQEEDLGRIEDGAIVRSLKRVGGKLLPDKVLWVGPTKALPKRYARSKRHDLKRRRALLPGLIDSHTHLVFAGNRADEFARRCGGESYESIARKGGGILHTVRATRAASVSELLASAVERARESYRYGVRTLEVKSGYGLSVEAELKVLKVIKQLRKQVPEMTFYATFLGAHAFPMEGSRESYLADLRKMMREAKRLKLADACDVFIDEGYYTLDEGRALLDEARELGFALKLHADELENTESAALACELGALSADHLLKVSDRGVQALANASRTVATLLPGTAFYLREAQAPARRLIDAGACVALSTDFNPGTCPTLHLPAVLTHAALGLGMTRAELFAAVTHNAAKALGLESRKGVLREGFDADFFVCPFARFEEIYYRYAWSEAAAR